MPLSKKCSRKSIGKNISSLISGKGHTHPRSQAQSIAIALDYARKSGCAIPHKNPPKEVLTWITKIYNAGRYYARLIPENISPNQANIYYKQSLHDLEDTSDIIFNELEKGLFLEGFLHSLTS